MSVLSSVAYLLSVASHFSISLFQFFFLSFSNALLRSPVTDKYHSTHSRENIPSWPSYTNGLVIILNNTLASRGMVYVYTRGSRQQKYSILLVHSACTKVNISNAEENAVIRLYFFSAVVTFVDNVGSAESTTSPFGSSPTSSLSSLLPSPSTAPSSSVSQLSYISSSSSIIPLKPAPRSSSSSSSSLSSSSSSSSSTLFSASLMVISTSVSSTASITTSSSSMPSPTYTQPPGK